MCEGAAGLWGPLNRTEQNRLHGLQPARLIALSTLGVPLNMRVSLSIENVHAPGDEVQHRVWGPLDAAQLCALGALHLQLVSLTCLAL